MAWVLVNSSLEISAWFLGTCQWLQVVRASAVRDINRGAVMTMIRVDNGALGGGCGRHVMLRAVGQGVYQGAQG